MEGEMEVSDIVPFAFHNIDEEKEIIENSKVLLKSSFESAWDDKIKEAFIELDDPNESIQINAAHNILGWALKQKYGGNIVRDILRIKVFYRELPYKILENRAAKYFIDTYGLRGPQYVSFLEKNDGAQVGRRILITLPTSETRTFYIKTHIGGSKSDSDFFYDKKPIDPKELLVYSVLQYLQLGPEVHYFWEDSINFYIATADLKEIGIFKEYKKIFKSLPNPEITPVLDPIHLQICKELTKLDLFSRIFRLSDAIINKRNFGFVELNGSQVVFLIDFIIKAEYRYTDNGFFDGFLAGMGAFSYQRNTDPTVMFALRKRKVEERCQIAFDFLKDFNIKEALEEGYRKAWDISTILEIPLDDVGRYYKDVKENIQIFEKG